MRDKRTPNDVCGEAIVLVGWIRFRKCCGPGLVLKMGVMTEMDILNFIRTQHNTIFGETLIIGTVIENSIIIGENQLGKEKN